MTALKQQLHQAVSYSSLNNLVFNNQKQNSLSVEDLLVYLYGTIKTNEIENDEEYEQFWEKLALELSDFDFICKIEKMDQKVKDLHSLCLEAIGEKIDSYKHDELLEENELIDSPIASLKYLMMVNNFDDNDMIEKLDTSRQTFWKISSGKQPVSKKMAIRLGAIFKVDPNMFIKRL